MSGRRLLVLRMAHLLPYEAGLARQEALTLACAEGGRDTLLLCEHPPVYTVGKRRTTHNLVVTPQELQALGAEVHHTLRGGDVTFHGPGQLVGYPVVHLRRLGCGARDYVEGLEDAMVRLAARHQVTARGRLGGFPGVWVGERKLGAVGVRVSQGVTSHGFALNVSTDLRFFKHIIPCGIADKGVTSLALEAPERAPPDMDEVAHGMAQCFAEQFGYADVHNETV